MLIGCYTLPLTVISRLPILCGHPVQPSGTQSMLASFTGQGKPLVQESCKDSP